MHPENISNGFGIKTRRIPRNYALTFFWHKTKKSAVIQHGYDQAQEVLQAIIKLHKEIAKGAGAKYW